MEGGRGRGRGRRGRGGGRERGSGSSSSTHTLDKSTIFYVKPLRTLVPIFPSNPQGGEGRGGGGGGGGGGSPPFAPPFGPNGSGFSPFYPFAPSQCGSGGGRQSSPPPDLNHCTPAPLRAFPAAAQSNGELDEVDGFSGSSSISQKPSVNRANNFASSSQKRAKKGSIGVVDGSRFVLGISLAQKDDGDREVVNNVLTRFDALRRRISQVDDVNKSPAGIFRRSDLKAGNILMTNGVRTNMKKRIGLVPGVEIGDIFFFRMEMCLVGLHHQSMAGIDYLIFRGEAGEDPLAVSIVSSGGYGDDTEDKDVLIYSGQGGNVNKKDQEASDQKLERGNLALERSLHRSNEVRVIRGMRDANSATTRVYVYDGLYKLEESWVEKGKSGNNMFKYKLVRIPGQPGAFGVWRSIQKWKEGLSSRAGLILPDLTSGAESVPVSLVNDFDEEKGPAYFTYFPAVKYSKSFKLTQPSYGCNCLKECQPGDSNCSCMQKNGGEHPYTAYGVLVSRKPMIYECGPTCPCFTNCKNRVSQTGLKVRLEVFKTRDRGWGLHSWDPIRAGTFICEYAGEVVDRVKARLGGEIEYDDYAFDTNRSYTRFRWNCEPGLMEEEVYDDSTEEYDIPAPFVLSAKNFGNVARFMNHSCDPNVFWQPIMYENNNESFLHIAFFAMRHIPPMTELTYDYGTSHSDEPNTDNAPQGKKKCLCGSPRCRGYYG